MCIGEGEGETLDCYHAATIRNGGEGKDTVEMRDMRVLTRMQARSQSVRGVVRELDPFFFRAELAHRKHWPKDLVLDLCNMLLMNSTRWT